MKEVDLSDLVPPVKCVRGVDYEIIKSNEISEYYLDKFNTHDKMLFIILTVEDQNNILESKTNCFDMLGIPRSNYIIVCYVDTTEKFIISYMEATKTKSWYAPVGFDRNKIKE